MTLNGRAGASVTSCSCFDYGASDIGAKKQADVRRPCHARDGFVDVCHTSFCPAHLKLCFSRANHASILLLLLLLLVVVDRAGGTHNDCVHKVDGAVAVQLAACNIFSDPD